MKKTTSLYSILFLLSGLVLFFIFLAGYTKSEDKNRAPAIHILDETVQDYDGNIYKTLQIGDQVWMAENLRVTHYRDGTPIPSVFDNDEWPHAREGAYCMVDNDSVKYKNTYGLLYNFYAVSNSRRLAPEGWHIPSEAE